MKKLVYTFTLLSGLFIVATQSVHAVCPVCTVAVAGGLGISRVLGIDDMITGLWIGGLVVSMSFWFAHAMKSRKRWPFLFSLGLFAGVVYATIAWILTQFGFIGLPGNELYGIDKMVLGIGAGSGLFILGMFLDTLARAVNNNQVFIYYQKVLLPVGVLSVASLLLYLWL